MAPAGAGIPTKKFFRHDRLIFVDHDVEARETQSASHGEQERRDPAEVFGRVQVGDVQHQRRRDAEVDEVGKRIEFGAEPRGSLQSARDSPVEAIKNRRASDRADRPVDRSLHRQADRRQAQAKREQRDEIGDQEPQRHGPEAAARRRAKQPSAPGAGGRFRSCFSSAERAAARPRPQPARSPSRQRWRANRRRPRYAPPRAGRHPRASRNGSVQCVRRRRPARPRA